MRYSQSQSNWWDPAGTLKLGGIINAMQQSGVEALVHSAGKILQSLPQNPKKHLSVLSKINWLLARKRQAIKCSV